MLCYIFLFLSNCSLISCSTNFSVINRIKFIFCFIQTDNILTHLFIIHMYQFQQKMFLVQNSIPKNPNNSFKSFLSFVNLFPKFVLKICFEYQYFSLFKFVLKIKMVQCALHAIM